MFTGIIAAEGRVQAASRSGGDMRVRIKKPAGWKLAHGESVNVDGVCSTVKQVGHDWFEVEYMPETVKRTTVGSFKSGSRVNLERALRLNNRLGGHLVQGHVDATGIIKERKSAGASVMLAVSFPKAYAKFIAGKGSITVNGVSLTVVEARGAQFSVSLVRHTLDHTDLRDLKKGDKVNLEVDVLARYLDALKKK